jgi:MFS family permease
MITGAVAFISLFTAGIFLGFFPRSIVLYGFTIIFLIAFTARLVSWHYLTKTADPPLTLDKTEEFSFIQYLKKLWSTNYGKFALYVGAMNFSVNIAGPFFTVYMLRDLHLSYVNYTIITAAAALTSFLAMNYWGEIADRFGNKSVLNTCGLLLTIVPLFWLFSKNVAYLVFAQVISGFVWAGFNLSTANFIFDNVKPIKRTRVFSYHNALNGTAVFLGAILGGLLARIITFKWVFYSNLQILFLISGLMRLATSSFFLSRIREVREVEYITPKDFFLKYSGTGPMLGLTYRTITGLKKITHTPWKRSEEE